MFFSLSDRRLQNSQKVLSSYKLFHVTHIWILQKNSSQIMYKAVSRKIIGNKDNSARNKVER